MRLLSNILCSLALAAAICMAAAAASPAAKARLNIRIEHYAGNALLQLDSSTYTNQLGQPFTVAGFKYYLGNMCLKNTAGAWIKLPGYFLVNEEQPESKQIELTGIPPGTYTSISFIIGVDSLHNCSGAQSGALDPVNGMFWTWNTGYIFLKLEGHAAASGSPGHIFEYHVGGYAAPNNCIRQVTLPLAKDGLQLSGGSTGHISIKADILQVLKQPVSIDFSKLSSVTDFHNAVMMADNYADIFAVNTGP